MFNHKVQIIDSHTGGEPTRLIIKGGPDLGAGTMAARLEIFKNQFDHFRAALVTEPKGSDIMVGALMCEPQNPKHSAGVIFFNNVGYLGMCGHGTIGLMISLFHLGRIQQGLHILETPVGNIEVQLHAHNQVSLQNVPSYRFAKEVTVLVEGVGPVVGDIAWGGNWFFLVNEESTRRHGIRVQQNNLENLLNFSCKVKQSLIENNMMGHLGAEIDHIELFGAAVNKENDSKNFVLCPGNSYDRSACGTGTSAKLACLFADGKIKAGQIWRQESIIGSVFEGSVNIVDEKIIPTITGSAFVTAESQLIFDERDPFCWGL